MTRPLSHDPPTPTTTTQESHKPMSLHWFAISTARYSGSSSDRHHHQHLQQQQPLQIEEAPTWPPLLLFSSKYTSPGLNPASTAARSCARCLVEDPWKHGQSISLEGANGKTPFPRKKVSCRRKADFRARTHRNSRFHVQRAVNRSGQSRPIR